MLSPYNQNLFTKSIYLVLLSLLFVGCKKADLLPINPTKVITTKADTIKSINYGSTDTSNPEYWFNGTTGPALVRVSCKDCNAIATIGDATIPFMFNNEGVGYLRYTPKLGLPIYIAICPGGVKAVQVDIFDVNNASLFNYSGVITSNWLNTYVVK